MVRLAHFFARADWLSLLRLGGGGRWERLGSVLEEGALVEAELEGPAAELLVC